MMEQAKDSGPRTIKDTLDKILREAQDRNTSIQAHLIRAWDEYDNSMIKQHLSIKKVHQGALFFEVDTAPWRYEIEHKYKQGILSYLQNKVGRNEIKKIILMVG